jgi:CTP synthase
MVVHLTLLPYLSTSQELKTKPTQHSVKMLLESGVQPDILVCRAEHPISKEAKRKIALFCNVPLNAVIEALDMPTIYDVPMAMLKEKLDKTVLSRLKLSTKNDPDMDSWLSFLTSHKNPKHEVKIGLVGKYVELPDAYKSIAEAFVHAGAQNECKVKLEYIHSELVTDENVKYKLGHLDGILVAPGFGDRGVDGKITAIKYAREEKIPFFGICLGMQVAVIEYARDVLGFKDAHSTEMNAKTKHPVIDMMPDQKKITNKGGTMRLGAYTCELVKGSNAYKAYDKSKIIERHRHRYEFNNAYRSQFIDSGYVISGTSPDGRLVEAVEFPNHPYFVATQFHPEFQSRPSRPHPLFQGLIQAALSLQNDRRTSGTESDNYQVFEQFSDQQEEQQFASANI